MKISHHLKETIQKTIEGFDGFIRGRIFRSRLALYMVLHDKLCLECQERVKLRMDAEIQAHGERSGEWPTYKQISGYDPLGTYGDPKEPPITGETK